MKSPNPDLKPECQCAHNHAACPVHDAPLIASVPLPASQEPRLIVLAPPNHQAIASFVSKVGAFLSRHFGETHRGDHPDADELFDLCEDLSWIACQKMDAAASPLPQQDLYQAYLLGCEDECVPEPKTLEQFMEVWEGR